MEIVTNKVVKPLKIVPADMHIHTCLSPCATLDMTPEKIVREALKKALSIIAITDHNSAENSGAVIAAAQSEKLYVIPGIEMTTSEEIHIIALFENVERAVSFQELIYDNLQSGKNNEDFFGIQVVANEFDEVEGINTRLLIGATSLRLDEAVGEIHRREGLAFAAHIDRGSFSIISQLGFIPEDLDLDAVEISKRITLSEARKQFKEYDRFPFITSSDAHDLSEIGTTPTLFQLAGSNIAEIRLALSGKEGRRVIEKGADL